MKTTLVPATEVALRLRIQELQETLRQARAGQAADEMIVMPARCPGAPCLEERSTTTTTTEGEAGTERAPETDDAAQGPEQSDPDPSPEFQPDWSPERSPDRSPDGSPDGGQYL